MSFVHWSTKPKAMRRRALVRRSPTFSPRLMELERRLAPAVFTVTTTADTGAGSLRQAILDANANAPSADTIVFGPVFNSLQTINLASSLPDVTDALTITGTGQLYLTVQRDPATSSMFRLISLMAPTTLSGMNLYGGRTTGATLPERAGGAISIRSTGPMTLLDVDVAFNSASGEGGGIFVIANGDLTIRNSTIRSNRAGTEAAGFQTGGGICFQGGGSLLMENCTVSGNSSPTGGGGIYMYGSSSLMNANIRNCTISGNTAPVGGGAELSVSAAATLGHSLKLQNSTVSGNSATSATAGRGGGGILRVGAGTGVVSITSTVVANNTSASGSGPDVLGAITSDFSLIRNQAGATITGSNNLAAGTDPLLGPLEFNGGLTQTMRIPAGSPLTNAGSNAAGLTTDQRGPGFARVDGAAADIGAFEV